jgi:hypothetical protein
MNKKLKKELATAFEPPKVMNKEGFLHTLNYPKITKTEFLHIQIGYIRKRVWCIFFLLLVVVIACTNFIDKHNNIISVIGIISAIVPFIALVMIIEMARSSAFSMAELEMTTRFQLSDIVIARMGILGTGTIIMFLLILPIISGSIGLGIVKTGIYILVPYLLTCIFSLGIVSHMKGKDAAYYCGVSSVVVSVFICVFGFVKQTMMYSEQYYNIWIFIFVISFIIVMIQVKQFIRKTEELEWNLYLMD